MRLVRLSAAALSVVIAVSAAPGLASAASSRSTGTGSQRPGGPAADLSEEITGENPPFIGEGAPPDLDQAGYVEREYVASGTATSYEVVGELGRGGRWTFEPAGEAPYRTRILVRRPAKKSRLSGTVVVEWNNVSGGVDANPDFASLEEEITRRGDVWVGVSVQLIGVEGGPVLVQAPGAEDVTGKGLKALDPARYGSLEHPGDGFSFDIFTQVARAVRRGPEAVGGAEPKRVLAVGESQSALALTTYYDGVQPLTDAFDGFLVHSRAGVSLPLVGPGEYADLAGSLGESAPAIFRTDLDTPVLDIQTEGDITSVLESVEVRQRDNPHFRLWEVASTAHADAHLLGPSIADALDCGAPVNAAPMHLVAKAALRSLDDWVRTGEAPPKATRIELTADGEISRDGDGIALGGIRTPPVDVPVDVLSGEPGPNPDLLCILLGSTTPLPADRLAQLYPSRAEYRREYEAAVDAAIEAGFVLDDDRKALLAFADPARIAG